MSQLALANEAGVTPRHVSFVESGRANPSREMVLRWPRPRRPAARAQPGAARRRLRAAVPRDRPRRRRDGQVSRALDRLLEHHEPHPAVVMDRHWNVLRTNAAANALFAWLLDGSRPREPAQRRAADVRAAAPARRQLGADGGGARPARPPRGGRRRAGPRHAAAARRGARAAGHPRGVAHARFRHDAAAASCRSSSPRTGSSAATSRWSRRSVRHRTSRCRRSAWNRFFRSDSRPSKTN